MSEHLKKAPVRLACLVLKDFKTSSMLNSAEYETYPANEYYYCTNNKDFLLIQQS